MKTAMVTTRADARDRK